MASGAMEPLASVSRGSAGRGHRGGTDPPSGRLQMEGLAAAEANSVVHECVSACAGGHACRGCQISC